MKPLQTAPAFVEVSYWRKAQIGLQGVSASIEADFAIVKVPGVLPLHFEMTADGRELFGNVMDALAVAHELGRRDVIDTVRGIFEKPAAK